jgi:hypothetical protein
VFFIQYGYYWGLKIKNYETAGASDGKWYKTRKEVHPRTGNECKKGSRDIALLFL